MELVSCLKPWLPVFGLGFDILGAVLVFIGVKINIKKANALEEVDLAKFIDDLGSPENIERNKTLSFNRAMERVHASNWAERGLICFLVGFLLQLIGSWPK